MLAQATVSLPGDNLRVSPSRSRSASTAVYDAGKRADVDFLINALGDVDMRMSAASWLGDLGAPSAVPALVRNLRVRNDLDRNSAVIALRKIGDPSAVPRLLELAQEDEAVGVRATAVDAVATLGDARGIALLIQLVIDPAAVLGTCSRNMDVRSIRKVRRGVLPRVARWATKRLCQLRPDGAAEQLEAALPSVAMHDRFRLRRAIRVLREPASAAK
jgi:HEAT repeat protein